MLKLIHLEQNYRSTQTILDAANDVITNNSNRKPKKLWTENGQGNTINYFRAASEQDEGYFVAGKLAEWKKEGASSIIVMWLFFTVQMLNHVRWRKY